MLKTSAKKTALLKYCIKEDVSPSQGEAKHYLVGLCETRFVERLVSIPALVVKAGGLSPHFCFLGGPDLCFYFYKNISA